MQSFFQQNARHIGGNAKAQIDGAARLQFLRDTARNRFVNVEFGQTETVERTEYLAGNCRIIKRLRGLLLVRIDHDIINQHTRHAHIMRLQRAFLGDALHLRNDDAAIVARGKRLIETAKICPLMLIGKITAFIRRGGTDNRHLRHDIGEEQPVLALKIDMPDDRLRCRLFIHRRTLPLGVNKCIKPHLGQHAGTLRRRLAMHVEQNAGRNIIGRDFIIGDHLPDQRRLGPRWPGRIGTTNNLFQKPLLGDVIDALNTAHITRSNRVQRSDILRMAGFIEPLTNSFQRHIRAAKAAGGRNRNDGIVRNESCGFRK